jgi:hypothetical protein
MSERTRGWLAAIGLVVVASIAVATAPQSGRLADPFVRTGVQGEVVHGRTFDVEVTEVRAAELLDLVYDESTLATDGVWVIIDTVVTSNVGNIPLHLMELRIDGVAYRTYDLPYPALLFTSYGPGVPVGGSLVFEVPASALEGGGLDGARVYFQTEVSEQLDDVPEVIVDLTDLDIARTEIIDEPVVLAVR